MDESVLRVPPHNEEAERGVLGSVLLDPQGALGKMLDFGLKPDEFYDRRHTILFSALLEMQGSGKGMDAITIADFLKDSNELDKVGGYNYLITLQDTTFVSAHVEHYADIVREKNMYRELTARAADLMDAAYKCEVPAAELVQGVPGRFTDLIDGATRRQSNQDVLDGWYTRMLAVKNGEIQNGLPLPWPELDAILCGLETGLIVVGARPSCGKTTMEVNISDSLVRQGCPVARACLDMSREQLLVRSAIRESRVSLPRVKYGFARLSQLNTIGECKDLVASWPHYIIEDRSLGGICSRARALKLKYDIQLLTVDFLTLIHVEKSYGNRVNDIGKITSTLKALALELDIPVLLLSQLNRGSAKDDRQPRLSDLRESGDIEQDATQVILMSKASAKDFPEIGNLPADAEAKTLRGIVVDVAKNQNGETGIIEMWMRPNYFRLESGAEDFRDIHGKLSEFTRQTAEDECCDPAEPVLCDNDEVEE